MVRVVRLVVLMGGVAWLDSAGRRDLFGNVSCVTLAFVAYVCVCVVCAGAGWFGECVVVVERWMPINASPMEQTPLRLILCTITFKNSILALG